MYFAPYIISVIASALSGMAEGVGQVADRKHNGVVARLGKMVRRTRRRIGI